MKRGRLIFNAKAGNTYKAMLPALLENIKQSGYYPSYDFTEHPQQLDKLLKCPCDALFVAGGDGTLREVTRFLLQSHYRPPIVLLPLGTANNVATTLMPNQTVDEIFKHLPHAHSKGFDVGQITHTHGQTFFLEAAGLGIFGNAMASYNPDQGKSIWRALWASLDTLSTFEPEDVHLTIDGTDFKEQVLMLEFMNTSSMGYKFKLAKDANVSDGLLDILVVRPSEKTRLLGYVASVIDQSFDELPNVEVLQGSHITLTVPQWQVHADAEILDIPNAQLTIDIMPQALEFLIPPNER
jgi:diacylglycerol kinase (ATP)